MAWKSVKLMVESLINTPLPLAATVGRFNNSNVITNMTLNFGNTVFESPAILPGNTEGS